MPQDIINGETHDTVIARGRAAFAQRTWQRPNNTTPYTAGSLIGDASTAVFEIPNIGKPGATLAVLAAQLFIDRTDLPVDMLGFEIDLYAGQPPAAVDGASFAFTRAAYQSIYRATLDIQRPAVRGSLLTRRERYIGEYITLGATATSLWFTLRTLGTTTPNAQTNYEVRMHLADVGA